LGWYQWHGGKKGIGRMFGKLIGDIYLQHQPGRVEVWCYSVLRSQPMLTRGFQWPYKNPLKSTVRTRGGCSSVSGVDWESFTESTVQHSILGLTINIENSKSYTSTKEVSCKPY
jgi:hypothetical protein